MSSQNPKGPAPRRRIAGERRSARPEESASPAPVAPEPTRGERRAERQRARNAEASSHAPGATGTTGTPVISRSSRRSGGAGPSWLVLALVGLLALVLVVVAALLGLSVWSYGVVRHENQVEETSRTAPSSAERAAATILSYNYRSLSADAKAAERYMTPSYEKKYAAAFTKLVRPNAAKLKAKVEAQVRASGVSHADPGRATVLLYVNQTTTSTANGGEPQQALNRVMLSMKQVDGTWLVDDITSY